MTHESKKVCVRSTEARLNLKMLVYHQIVTRVKKVMCEEHRRYMISKVLGSDKIITRAKKSVCEEHRLFPNLDAVG